MIKTRRRRPPSSAAETSREINETALLTADDDH
jgi:hypothetical protein